MQFCGTSMRLFSANVISLLDFIIEIYLYGI